MEENKRVYICDVDYLYMPEAAEYKELAGGAVYVFVKAFDVRETLELLDKNMKDRYIEPKEIVSINPYDENQEWASDEEQAHYRELSLNCDKSGEIVYDDFLAYEREE